SCGHLSKHLISPYDCRSSSLSSGTAKVLCARSKHRFRGVARRALLLLKRKIVIADEPASALDLSAGVQVLLLQELQREVGLTYIVNSTCCLADDQIAKRLAIMRAGQIGTRRSRANIENYRPAIRRNSSPLSWKSLLPPEPFLRSHSWHSA